LLPLRPTDLLAEPVTGAAHPAPRPRRRGGLPGPSTPRPARRGRVVIADDDALVRQNVAELLIADGFDVVGQASDGAQAVVLTGQLAPDVVVLDVVMPVQDGIDAAAEIAAEHRAPVVLLSAFHDDDLRQRAVRAGVHGYVSKGSIASSLLPALELAMAHHARQAALRDEVATSLGRLRDRRVIDRAKVLLMHHHRISEDEAFRRLHRTAMDQRMPMVLVAIAITAQFSGLGS
jgi:AmiR/NasT family two-component response regulator